MSTITITAGGASTTWKTAVPFGFRETRQAPLDVAHAWGRVNDGSLAPVRRETELTFFVHRRGDAASLAAALASAYAAAQTWVSSTLTIVDSVGGTLTGCLSAGWEFAPQWVDDQTVTVRLEVVSWEA